MKQEITNDTLKKMRFILTIVATVSILFCGCSVSVSQTSAEPAEVTAADIKDTVLSDLPTHWDLTELYADEASFEADMRRIDELTGEIGKLRGTLGSVEGILGYLESPYVLEGKSIEARANLYTTSLASLNASDGWARKAKAEFMNAHQKLDIALSFVDSEIMQMPLEKRQEIFSNERLAPYAYYMRKYTDPDYVELSEDVQTAEALMQSAANSKETRGIFENTDLPYPSFTYPDGTEGVLKESVYSKIIKSSKYDHDFRKEIFELRNSTRQPYVNTYASLLEGTMQKNRAEAKISGFDSTLAKELHDTDIDPEVYERIIEFAHSLSPKVNKYYRARKECMGLDEMMFCDISVPLTDYASGEISYEDAVNTGRKALGVWGDDYIGVFDSIITSPHVDVYPADTKRTGAYNHADGKETTPFVLFNFNGTQSYISTIVHEMGHAVQNELSIENQNVYNCHPEIFIGEVASTANEIMLHRYMIENASSPEEKLFWLDDEIDLFLGALYRQCLLSEFEDYCYKTIEAGGALTADDLSDRFLELFKQYYGDSLTITDDIGTDWTRYSGLYNNYYVYKYATSITYAASICDQVEEKGQDEIDAYLDFLKAGQTASPTDLLGIANVDPLKDDTYEAAGKLIGGLIDEFAKTARDTSEHN